MMALAVAMAQKAVVAGGSTLLGLGVDSTIRTRGVSKVTQLMAWAKPATVLGVWGGCEISLGSACNAVRASPDDYDFVINACKEVGVKNPVRSLHFRLSDNNLVNVNLCKRTVDGMITRLTDHVARRRMDWTEEHGAESEPPPMRVLVHCFWGCSRGAVLAILLAANLAHNYVYDDWHNLVTWRRPCIDIALMRERNARTILEQQQMSHSLRGASSAPEAVWSETAKTTKTTKTTKTAKAEAEGGVERAES